MSGPSAPSARPSFLGRIESVRGLAALAVAVGHTMGFLLIREGMGRSLLDQPTPREALEKIAIGLIYGETAVLVFFVISGVVIARSLDGRDAPRGDGRGSGRRDFVPFMIRRVLRLYPAHIVATLGIVGLGLLFFAGRTPIDFAAFPGSYPSHSADAANWLNGSVFNPLKWQSVVGNLAMATWSMNLVVWSLYVEVCAAPLLPLFHVLARKANLRLDVVVLVVLIGLALLNWQHLWSRYFYAFYLGMMVETHGVVLAERAERLLGGRGRTVAVLYLAMMLPMVFAAQRSPAIILSEAFTAFALLSVIVRSEGGWRLRSLDHPVLRWNGRLSYSFYLWHLILMTVAVRALYATLPAATMARFDLALVAAVAILTIALALAIAQLSYRYVEVPGIALGRRLAGVWRGFSSGTRRSPGGFPSPATSARESSRY